MKRYVVVFSFGEDIVHICNTEADSKEQAVENTEYIPYFWGLDYDNIRVIEQEVK